MTKQYLKRRFDVEQTKIAEELYPYFEKTGKLTAYQPGETIYFQGESADRLYLVKKGRVRVFYVTKAGKELTFEVIEKGKLIGESSFLSTVSILYRQPQ